MENDGYPKEDLKSYMRLKWTYTIEPDSHDGKDFYIIRVNELPGVCTDAESVEKGMKAIKEPMKAAIKLYMSNGEKIPEPIKSGDAKTYLDGHDPSTFARTSTPFVADGTEFPSGCGDSRHSALCVYTHFFDNETVGLGVELPSEISVIGPSQAPGTSS